MRTTGLLTPLLVFGSLVVATASGCLVTVFPSLATVTEPTTDDSILGVWRVYNPPFSMADGGSTDRWIEIHRDGKGYRIDGHEVDGRVVESREFIMFQIGKRQYIEFAVSSDAAKAPQADAKVLCWLEQGQDTLRLRIISEEWLEKQFGLADEGMTTTVRATAKELHNALLEAPDSAFDAHDPHSISWRRPPQQRKKTEASQ